MNWQHLITSWIGQDIVVIATIAGIAKPVWSRVIKPLLTKVDPQAVKAVDKGIHWGKEIWNVLAKDPVFAAEAKTGELKAEHILKHLHDTKLAEIAGRAVAVFESRLGKKLDGMSSVERQDLTNYVEAALTKAGVTGIPSSTVIQALKDASAANTWIEQNVIPEVQKHEATTQAWAGQTQPPAPATPASAPQVGTTEAQPSGQ